jgi:hypothetical protein
MTMNKSNPNSSPKRPSGITFLAIVNLVALVVTIVFWALVYFGQLVPKPGSLVSLTERANAAVTYGFMLGDVLYSVPLLLLAGIGLWRLRSWGWLAAQMANILWIYSMTVILLRDSYSTWSPGGLLFIPFSLVAIGSIPYLWSQRRAFGIVN